jgi:hypothetical protein
MAVSLSRRSFLARTGLLAAGVAVGHGLVRPSGARAQSADDLLGPLLEGMDPVLAAMAVDALAGIGAFVVPSTDDYSVAQGVTDDRPGAIAAENPAFLLDALDKKFLPFPDTAAAALAQAFLTGTTALPLPGELAAGLLEVADQVDAALNTLIDNDQTVPTSAVIAGYFNFVATMVDPSSIAGEFTAPFANLSWEDKAEVFRMIEEDHADLAAQIDGDLDEPMSDSVSGLLKFVPGALLEFAAFGSYSEFHVYDRDADPMRLADRPVGWQLTGYQEGMLSAGQGWDEFLGYHKGVRDVAGSWDRGEGVAERMSEQGS